MENHGAHDNVNVNFIMHLVIVRAGFQSAFSDYFGQTQYACGITISCAEFMTKNVYITQLYKQLKSTVSLSFHSTW